MRGKYNSVGRWVGGKSPTFVDRLWRRIFQPTAFNKRQPWEWSEAANVLRALSECPTACHVLAEALELEGDPGESLGTWVAEIAKAESLKATARNAQMYADEAAEKARQ